jgi:hypothetical protein
MFLYFHLVFVNMSKSVPISIVYIIVILGLVTTTASVMHFKQIVVVEPGTCYPCTKSSTSIQTLVVEPNRVQGIF